MTNWSDDQSLIDEDSFVAVDAEIYTQTTETKTDARRRLESLLEERRLKEDLEDFY